MSLEPRCGSGESKVPNYFEAPGGVEYVNYELADQPGENIMASGTSLVRETKKERERQRNREKDRQTIRERCKRE